MGFKNYKGEVYDVNRIAIFYSRTRAEEYVKFCESTADDTIIYSIGEYRNRKDK